MSLAGEGRVHQCLRDSFSKLTEACRKEELKLNIIQARDVRLRPKLNKACSEEIAVFCKGVPPGARPRWPRPAAHALCVQRCAIPLCPTYLSPISVFLGASAYRAARLG